MRHRTLLTTLTAAGLAATALGTAPALAGPGVPASTTVVKSFHSSSGGGTTARISDHGNIVDYLSPDSNDAGHYEHIGVGDIGEGYVLCYTGASGLVNAWDTGVSESGFGPATLSGSTATAITVTRKTADNRLTLIQNITFNGVERAVRIKMTVKNNTASPVPGVVLRRQVDFDVDTGGTDGWAGFANWHAATSLTSAFAWNDPSEAPPAKDAHAMSLKFVTSPSVTTTTGRSSPRTSSTTRATPTPRSPCCRRRATSATPSGSTWAWSRPGRAAARPSSTRASRPPAPRRPRPSGRGTRRRARRAGSPAGRSAL